VAEREGEKGEGVSRAGLLGWFPPRVGPGCPFSFLFCSAFFSYFLNFCFVV
jgi:hypothetical protein